MTASTDQDAIKRAVKEIRRFYLVGRKTLAKHDRQLPWGKGPVLAAKLGWNRDKLEKARQFGREVSKREVNQLCRKIEDGGFRVTVQHVARLLSVKDPKRRWSFIDKTIEKNWSCRDLAVAIQQRMGRRQPRSGRKIRLKDRAYAVARLSELCVHWQRLYMAVKGNDNGDKAVGVQLPPGVRQELKACDSDIGRFYRRLLKERRR